MMISISSIEIPVREMAERPFHAPDLHLHRWIAKHCGIAEDDVVGYEILHRSIDARRKPDVRLVYALHVTVRDGCVVREHSTIAHETPPPDHNHFLYQLPVLPSAPKHPLIVGTGPAGLMAAYLLALHGCQPIILERGFPVEQRTADVEMFLQTRQLHPDSNYLFGEGGAGTFSDGKLYTRIKDDRMRFLLEAYVAARAPRRILYDAHPHIGSDILPYMVKRLRQQIEAWGGQFRWGANVADILIRNHRCGGVILKNGEIVEAPLILIASGHSARQLIRQLVQHGVKHALKDFQLGCRIEHPQAMIDLAQYGWIPPRHIVGSAAYNLVSRNASQKGVSNVTTFCMCPGGEVIPAISDDGQLCTNGMSRFRRNGKFANAALIVNQAHTNFQTAADAFELISLIERQAFLAGQPAGNYACPAQSAQAFARGERGLPNVKTSYRPGVTPGRLDQLLPKDTVKALQAALVAFEKIIPGFMRSGVLIGVETRVSSPVRFERDPETLDSSLPGLYLAGEGAGSAGGITSAALDGLRIAETILTGKPAQRRTS